MAITLHGTRASNTDILTPDFDGAVVQMVTGTDSSNRTRAANSYGTLVLNAAITPSNSSNKIICIFTGVIEVTDGGRANLVLSRAISGGATTELNGGSSLTREQDTSNHNVGSQFTFVDSPSTTSATTYTLHGKTENSNTLTLVGTGSMSSLTLIEVVA